MPLVCLRMPTEQELIDERKKKREELLNKGINPYPYTYDRTSTAQELQETHAGLKPDESTGSTASIAGRLVSLRRIGKLTFGKLQDETGKIQVQWKRDELDNYDLLKLYDVGDWIGVEGELITTRTGELTVKTRSFQMLGKSLRPLPEKWHGLKDIEQRYRKRYLDLIINPEVKDVFVKRAQIIQAIRDYLDKREFVEVETPVLQSLYGGTNAEPFKTHLNALKQDMYLRIAPELYLKRLVVGGFLKVYEIAKNFRNESADSTHNPEFTMLEFYEAFTDYHGMMQTAEDMYKHIAKTVFGSLKVKQNNREIDLSGRWPKLCMTDAIKEQLRIDVDAMSLEELQHYAEKHKLETIGTASKGLLAFTIFDKLVAEKLEGPVWIIDYPKEISPLAKPHRTKPGYVERFECYIAGREVGDGWSEIIDPIEQRERFENEQKQMRAGNKEAHPLDLDFIESMEYGMPVLGGIGIGIDRLVMFFTNQDSIRDVLLFPFMRK